MRSASNVTFSTRARSSYEPVGVSLRILARIDDRQRINMTSPTTP